MFSTKSSGESHGKDKHAHAAGGTGASPPPAASRSMGESVTPHAPITGPRDFRYLAHGIDTLDLSLYVEWPEWADLFNDLNGRKRVAQSSHDDAVVWEHPEAGHLLVLASGSSSGYMFRLQVPHYHIFLAARDKVSETPNVRISIGAVELWTHGAEHCEKKCRDLIEQLGGRVERSQVSRCDLAVDFWIDGGLSFDFLRASRISKSRKTFNVMDDDRLETFYVGKGAKCVQLRIYDKSKELLIRPEKNWIRQVWNCEYVIDIWRTEYQLRREFLRNHNIDTLDDLKQHFGGIWKYLTGDWASFRLPDDVNTTRRTVHPWWQHIQNCADLFGDAIDLKRRIKADRPGSSEWYIAHIAGCLPGFAVAKGFADLESALFSLYTELDKHWRSGERDWAECYAVRALQANQSLEEAHDDIPI